MLEIKAKPPSSFQDSLIIQEPAAVFFEPDSIQLEKIREVNEKMIFESLTHDCFYQMQNASQVLDRFWPQIKLIHESRKRWLIFKKNNQKDSVIDLDKIQQICGIYLFDPSENPVKVDMTNIDTQLGFYFRKK